MKESLEEKYGVTIAKVMESQSEMIFKAREEINKLHNEVEELSKKNLDIEMRTRKDLESQARSYRLSAESLVYACKIILYMSDKFKYLLDCKEIEDALGPIPQDFLMVLKSARLSENNK